MRLMPDKEISAIGSFDLELLINFGFEKMLIVGPVIEVRLLAWK